MTGMQTNSAAQHAHPAFHLIDTATERAAQGVSDHRPDPAASQKLRLSVLAAAAGLIGVVLAASVTGPIKTAGTQMEPGRFQAALPKQEKLIQLSAADVTMIRGLSAIPPHR